MNIEELREYCLKKQGATESMPFGDDTLVFKVGGKMFLLAGIREGNSFNVKCDPELAIDLRERYAEVQPGYHMNKKMWNTVYIDGGLTSRQLIDMIDHSYELIVNNLPKKIKDEVRTGS
ncbi:MAG: MmcQ/YjbR family DNA-binding protein [Bacteroidota bacterium]|nr:MmcQ/YjbR family DNA-binding protein [Bacteroidota bacterium]